MAAITLTTWAKRHGFGKKKAEKVFDRLFPTAERLNVHRIVTPVRGVKLAQELARDKK